MNSQDQPHPFGYDFQEAFQDYTDAPPTSNQPLLNPGENTILETFFENANSGTNLESFNILSQLENANPWRILEEPPPTIRDITIASSPHASSAHLGHQISIETGGNVNAAMLQSRPHQNHGSVRSMQRNSGMSPPSSLQRLQTQVQSNQPHQLAYSPMLQQTSSVTARTAGSANIRRIQAVHTPEALTGINSPETMEQFHTAAEALMLSALPQLQGPSLGDAQFTLANTATKREAFESQPTNARLYHFGSDESFANNGYQPSSNFESHEYRGHLLTEELERLKPINRTPIATRDPTPEPVAPINHKKKRPASDAVVAIKKESAASGHKRKRSNMTPQSESENGEAEDQNGTQLTSSKRQRRISAPGANRTKKENLTEKQKRDNHIASEQKRRAQIKLGYDEMNRLVPELKDSGLSKSGMLQAACDFLQKLKDQNAAIAQRLGHQRRG